jgi:hypothetical protein
VNTFDPKSLVTIGINDTVPLGGIDIPIDVSTDQPEAVGSGVSKLKEDVDRYYDDVIYNIHNVYMYIYIYIYI